MWCPTSGRTGPRAAEAAPARPRAQLQQPPPQQPPPPPAGAGAADGPAEDAVPPGLLADLERLAARPLEGLDELLAGSEREALGDRIDRLLEDGVFPEPLGDRPPYPWPLI